MASTVPRSPVLTAAADCSSSPTSKPTRTRESFRGSQSDSAGARITSSEQDALLVACPRQPDTVSSPAAPSLLHLLLRLSIQRKLHVCSPGAAPPASSGRQQIPVNHRRPKAFVIKLFVLLFSGGKTTQLCEAETPALHLPRHAVLLNGLQQQILLPLPLMAVIRKISHLWSILGFWMVISCTISFSSRGARMFRSLSNRLAEGGFIARLFSYILNCFGCERQPFARLADFVVLVSSLFRHAAATLSSAVDVLNKISEFHAISDDHSTTVQSAPSPNESSETTFEETIGSTVQNRDNYGGHSNVKKIVVSSIDEGKAFISQWKEAAAQIVDVPQNMSIEIASELKVLFQDEGADHLLQGANIKLILERALVSVKSDSKDATQKVEEIPHPSRPSCSSGRNADK
ncbi:hypothetical protein ACP70R_040932 [Stipagrostis hirtigluma subsp. patula]